MTTLKNQCNHYANPRDHSANPHGQYEILHENRYVMGRCQAQGMMPIALPIQKFRLKFFKRHKWPETQHLHNTQVLRHLSSHHIPSHSMRVHLLLYICFCHCHVRYKVGLLLLLLLF